MKKLLLVSLFLLSTLAQADNCPYPRDINNSARHEYPLQVNNHTWRGFVAINLVGTATLKDRNGSFIGNFPLRFLSQHSRCDNNFTRLVVHIRNVGDGETYFVVDVTRNQQNSFVWYTRSTYTYWYGQWYRNDG